jgi:hypothetical protein
MSENKEDKFEITDEEIFEEIFEEKEVPLEGEIGDTLNFDELYDLIKKKERITGSKEKYRAEYLIAVIEDFRKIFNKLMDTANKEDPTEKTNLLELFCELSKQLGKITRKEELRFKVLQLSLREIKKTK